MAMPGHLAGLQRVTISLVQAAANHSSTLVSSLTVTLSSPATAGNLLVACIGGHNASSVTTVTSSASPDNWGTAAAVTASAGAETCEIWADPGCSGGNTTVTCTTTVGGLVIMQVLEFSGVASSSALDVTAAATSSVPSTSWSSGSTGTAQAGDLIVGASCGYGGSGAYSLVGPSSPWTNEAYIATSLSGIYVRLIAGYQVLSGAGSATYSGTSSPYSQASWGAAAVALKSASGGGGSGSGGAFLPFFS
jgi:hypothetical protein